MGKFIGALAALAIGAAAGGCGKETSPAAAPPPMATDRIASKQPDTLDKDALAAQRSRLDDQENNSRMQNSEDFLRSQLNDRVLTAFSQAVAELKSAGVRFESAQRGFDDLNAVRRTSGLDDLDLVQHSPDATLFIVKDKFDRDAFALVYLAGTGGPQTFGPKIPDRVLGPNDDVGKGCLLGVPLDPRWGTQKQYACADVISGGVDKKLVADAKKYLTLAISE